MSKINGFCGDHGVPSLLVATLHMDEAVQIFSRHISMPFASPSDDDPDWEVWYRAEEKCRGRCEVAIQEWITSRNLPILDDDEAYFLSRRFSCVSQFLQRLFLHDHTSIFSHFGSSLEDVLWWALVDWWEEHGIYDVFTEDFAHEEDLYNKLPRSQPPITSGGP